MDNILLKQLAKRLNLTDLEEVQEDFILSVDEVVELTENAIKAAKEHFIWRRRKMGESDTSIDHKISLINWEEEIDRESLIKQANSNKHHKLWEKEQRRKGREMQEQARIELKKRCTAKYMFWVLEQSCRRNYNRELVVDEDNKELIVALCYFLSGDKRFETELGYSLSKGLYIRGISGLGKTFLAKCLKDNEYNPIQIFSTLSINEDLRETGTFHVELSDSHITYLDDVGTEEAKVNYYGTHRSFVKEFIESIYLTGVRFNRLMISTNNSFKEIEEKYGFRVRSRIKDMFNIIDVQGKDRRG